MAHAVNAAAALKKEGMSIGVVNVHTIKPLDIECVQKWAGKVKRIFTAEDHNVIGGLGSAVAEVLAQLGKPVQLTRLGVQDTYGESGTPEELYAKYALDANGLARNMKATLNSN